jgi:hypothetical protein
MTVKIQASPSTNCGATPVSVKVTVTLKLSGIATPLCGVMFC